MHVRLLYSFIVYKCVNFLSSLFTLCYFFLYLKMVLYARDCSCIINSLGEPWMSGISVHTCIIIIHVYVLTTIIYYTYIIIIILNYIVFCI